MIKTTKKSTPRPLLAILLAIVAVSCTREEFVPDSSSDSGDYLRFSFSAAPQTRVAMDEETGAGTFEEGDAIGLYSFIEWGYESDYFTLTQRGGEWTPRLTREELGGTGRTLHACYPASDRLQDKFNYPFEVAADQSGEETYRNSDLLWGSCPLPDGNTVDIAFRHMMFRLNVDFSRIEGTVSDVKIRGRRGGVVQLTNGEFFPDREEEYGWIKAYQRKDGLWSVYMSPQTTQYANYYKEGEVQICFMLRKADGESKECTYTVGKDLSKLESGKQATVRLRPTGTSLDPEEPDPQYAGKKIWVYGISSPVFKEEEAREFPADATYDGYPTGVWYSTKGKSKDAYYLKWSEGCGWYDCNKSWANDENMCWAAAASNMLHWWTAENAGYIKKYDAKYGLSEQYPRPSFEFSTDGKSPIFQLFVDNFLNNGSATFYGTDWFLTGKSGWAKTEQYQKFPGFFHEALGSRQVTRRENLLTKGKFNRLIKEAFQNGMAVGFDISYSGGGLHALTLWGAEFDEEGYVSHIYYTDSDDSNRESQPESKGPVCRRRPIVYHQWQNLENCTHMRHYDPEYSPKYDDAIINVYLLGLETEKWTGWEATVENKQL